MNNDNKNNKDITDYITKIIRYDNIILNDEKMKKINVKDLKVVVSYIIRSSDYKSITVHNKIEGIKLFKTLIHDIEDDYRFSDEEIKKYCIVCCNRVFEIRDEYLL